MKVLFWIVFIALLFVAGFFAVANREVVEIDLWPVFTKVAMPLYLGLVGAFAGLSSVLAAYRHAVDQRYRFFSYGDAMFITRGQAQAG